MTTGLKNVTLAYFLLLVYQLAPINGTTWESGDYPFPTNVVLGAGFSVNDNIAYILDVRGDSGDSRDPAMYKLDTTVENPSWETLSVTIPFDSTIERDQSCQIGEKFYFFHYDQQKIFIFDTTTDTFLRTTNLALSEHSPDSDFSFVSDGNNFLYILGGQSETYSSYIQQYDIQLNKWSILSRNAPYDRWFWLNVAIYPPLNRIYVFGGYQNIDANGIVGNGEDFYDIYYFDIDSFTWSDAIGTIPMTRFEPIVYIPEMDKIYIFVGHDEGVSIYDPTTNVYNMSTNSPDLVCDASAWSTAFGLNYRLQEFGGTSNGVNCRTEEIYFPQGCGDAEADSFDWDTLINDGVNIPYISEKFSIAEDTLSLNIKVELEYEGAATAEGDGPFGVTYVLDFEDIDAHEDDIFNPGTCQNRVATDFYKLDNNALLRDFSEWWVYSNDPNVPGNIGTRDTMAYPPPGDFWSMQMKHNDTCGVIVYEGSFTWNELVKCAATENGTPYVSTKDGPYDITLSGVFYVNVISPYRKDTDDGYYRVYQLLSKPFEIKISKTVYVLGSAGINVLTMSVIAVYKEKQENDFRLVILTESQNYLQLSAASTGYLFNPDVTDPTIQGVITQDKFTWPIDSEQGNGCLTNKQFICSQLWIIQANQLDCKTEAIDFSGKYTLNFDTSCRDGQYNEYCDGNTTSGIIGWLNEHPAIKDGVSLETHLTWRDEICDPQIFNIQFEADMKFYKTNEYKDVLDVIDGDGIPDGEGDWLFHVGKDEIFVKIETDFKSGNTDIFDTELTNVWICTFAPDIIPDAIDATTGSGGCMDTRRDGGCLNDDINECFDDNDDNNYFYHIYNGENVPVITQEGFNEILTPNDKDILKFYFKVPRQIARDTLYVQAQVEVTLVSGQTTTRRILLVPNGKMANQMDHFIKKTGLAYDDRPVYKPDNNYPQPQEPINYPQPQAPLPEPSTFVINLSSPWIIGIGILLGVVLTFNIIYMCYMNCNKQQRGRVSFDRRRRNGYSSVKNMDSDVNNDSEINAFNVVSEESN